MEIKAKPCNIVKKKVLTLEEQKTMLAERFQAAKQSRQLLEGEWQSNEVTVYDVGEEGGVLRSGGESNNLGFSDADAEENTKGGAEFMAINLISRNKQLIHSQLCSNPPAVMTTPESSEGPDRDAAFAAEYVTAYAREQYEIIDSVAIATNSVFDYGTGFIKNVYDGSKGEILEDTEEGLIMEGDNVVTVPSIWDMYLDPNASKPSECNWAFERVYLSLEQALHLFGSEHKERLSKEIKDYTDQDQTTDTFNSSMLYNKKYKVLSILEYWEKGLPENGYQGRHGYCFDDGYLLKPLCPSPCRFRVNAKSSTSPKKARLPYSILTYIDVPGSPYGRSPVAHTSRQQEMLNNCISVMISVAETVGVPKVLLPKGSVDKETMTNRPEDLIEYSVTEGVPPYVIQAASVSQDIHNLIAKLEQYINDGWGVNDAMFGKQQREQSALLMQLSTVQGNLIRQRLFDKYVIFVKDIYELQLQYCIEYWDTKRTIKVLGEDNALKVRNFKGADLVGGYSIVVEYGQSFALDPITRGEQLLRFSELFLGAGMTQRDLVKKLRLAELRTTYDEFKQADDRAREIIERIKATKTQSPILSKYQDHVGIIAYMQKYTMDKDFEQLDEITRKLINEHIDARYQIQLTNTTGVAAGMGALPPGAPQPPVPGMIPQQ